MSTPDPARSPLWLSLVIAAACALAAAVLLLADKPHARDPFVFEVSLASAKAGHVQVYWDRGTGYNEEDSSTAPVPAGGPRATYRLPIGAAHLTRLRFDPIDTDGSVTFESPRIINSETGEVRPLHPGDFTVLNQIDAYSVTGSRAALAVTPGCNDPQLLVPLQPSLSVRTAWRRLARATAARALPLLLVLAPLLVWAERSRSFGLLKAALAAAVRAHPRTAIAAIAGLAAALSAYPILVMGRSLVSPGCPLLYEQAATLPGMAPPVHPPADPKGSDIGAILWQQVPQAFIQHQSWIGEGRIPQWNRYVSGGIPLLGQGQSMVGDPLHLLPVLAGGASWAWDLKYLAAKWILAFGLGMLVWMLTGRTGPALLIAFAAPFLGFFVYRINHPAFFSFCYAPWPLCCWLHIAGGSGRRRLASGLLALAGANWMLMASGTVKEAYLLLGFVNLSGLLVLLLAELSPRERLVRLGWSAWSGVLFLFVSAPLWGPFLMALRVACTSYDTPYAFQLQPSLALAAFDESLFRPLVTEGRVFNPSANFLILAGILYFLATLTRQLGDRRRAALSIGALVPLLFAFGVIPPTWIVQVPLLSNVHHIDDASLCAFFIVGAVLAGCGLQTAIERIGRPEGRGDLLIGALLLGTLLASYLGFAQAAHRPTYGAGSILSVHTPGGGLHFGSFLSCYVLSLLAGLGGLAWIGRRALQRGRWTAGALLLFGCCLSALLWRQGLQADGIGSDDFVVHPGPRAAFPGRSEAVALIQRTGQGEPARTVGVGNNFFPGWNSAYLLESISGPDPLMNPRYRELTDPPPFRRLWDWRLFLAPSAVRASRPLLDMLNVGYYLALPSQGSSIGSASGLILDRRADLDVYASPTVWPRAFFTDRAQPYGSAQAFVSQVEHGDGAPFAAFQSTDPVAARALAGLPAGLRSRTVIRASGYRLDVNRTAFDVESTGPGVIVLTETLWPGWSRATLDGVEVPVLRVNHAFQGLAVGGAGRHRVTVSYSPPHFGLLLLASAAGLVLGGASLLLSFRNRCN